VNNIIYLIVNIIVYVRMKINLRKIQECFAQADCGLEDKRHTLKFVIFMFGFGTNALMSAFHMVRKINLDHFFAYHLTQSVLFLFAMAVPFGFLFVIHFMEYR